MHMARTLFRLGLWIVLAALVLHVLRETFPKSPNIEMISPEILTQSLVLGLALLVLGIVTLIVGKATTRPGGRCVICKTPVPHGSIYCRNHLRRVLADEDDRRHMSRVR